ncbi:hypothetical protein BVG79_01073 [Ketogulonicigenium robustum]|uniref:Uncharacterized protein n=1 Tax=Ketogulonicigenium robustum TaxID=92947 RepID=A0A1W6NYZ9_9RHOB|nr:hypothetical protein BVG79_01073 [Ketogulonicigenium robustum]
MPAETRLQACIARRAHQQRRAHKDASTYEGTHLRLARELQAIREAGL